MSIVLITGAAGRIGSSLARRFQGRYDVRLVDARTPTHTYGFPFVEGNIADFTAMQAACHGVDTVIHLAANPDPDAPWDDLLPSNVVGTYHVFEAARLAGCQRIIFASSVHAVMAYAPDHQVHTSMPPLPTYLYGATKVWGEALGSNYYHQYGLSVICLRFGWVVDREELTKPTEAPLDMALTLDDLGRLVEACIDAPADFGFAVFHGVSNNRWKRYDISDARRRLGFAPEDDAFAIAGVALPD